MLMWKIAAMRWRNNPEMCTWNTTQCIIIYNNNIKKKLSSLIVGEKSIFIVLLLLFWECVLK